MLNNLRSSLQPHLEKIGKTFAATGISPNGWSCIGLVFAFASAFVYGWNIEFSLIIGGIILLVAGFFDIARFNTLKRQRFYWTVMYRYN